MKNAQRLDYESLAQVLGQRDLVEAQRLEFALKNSTQGSSPFPEVLVTDDLVGDWELSRVVCELYSLPFVPVDVYEPDMAALEGLDVEFLCKHRLVPLARHGDLLTVAMPALVPAEVLGSLAAAADVHVLPLVGTVESNNRWLQTNLAPDAPPAAPAAPVSADAELEAEASGLEVVDDSLDALPALPSIDEEMDWSNIFDEGDAAVLMDLTANATAETDDEPAPPEAAEVAEAPKPDLPPPLAPPAD